LQHIITERGSVRLLGVPDFDLSVTGVAS